MKKLLFAITALAISATLFTSCKKDYTCTCKITTGGTTTTQAIPINNTTKSKAQDDCNAAKTTYTTSVSTADCSL